MKIALILGRGVAVWFGVVMFFGQVFCNNFTMPGNIMGCSAVLAALFSWMSERRVPLSRFFVVLACISGVTGVVLDAMYYYTTVHAPGNYWAWFLFGPFCIVLLFIAVAAIAGKASDASETTGTENPGTGK